MKKLIEFKNFDHWIEYSGAAEGSGRSRKIWLKNPMTKEIGLFKYPKTEDTTEHVSEMISMDIADFIGLRNARIDIGTYKSEIGSMSYLINNEKQILIEGIGYIMSKYPNYDPNTMYDKEKCEYYSLEMILASIGDYDFVDDFLKILVFDFLIGNTDRHQNNWAVIDDNSPKICPMYDNGSSLCCYIKEDSINLYIGKDFTKFKSLVDTKSKSRVRICKSNKKEPTHLEMIRHLKSNYYDSVIKVVNAIIDGLKEEVVESIIYKYPDEIISKSKKSLIKKFIVEKVNLLEQVFRKEV